MSGLRSFLLLLALATLAALLHPRLLAAQWRPNGVPLCTAAGDQRFHSMVSDGAGGAIVIWLDGRNTEHELGGDIYAQRISAAGVPLWMPDGVPIAVGFTILRGDPAITADGQGGAIITWEQYRSTGNLDIYAQLVNAAGLPHWTPNGVLLCAAAGYQSNPTIVSDGAGGGDRHLG